MALAQPPSWESFGFPDVLNFGVQGAKLGLERAGQTLGADEAAQRLGLGYAQLASENARSAAAQAGESQRSAAADALARFKEMNDLEIARQSASAMNAYRGSEMASRSFRDALALHRVQQAGQPAPAPEVQYANVNGRLIPYLVDKKTGRGTWAPSGALSTEKVGALTPVQREQLRGLRKEHDELSKKWAGGGSKAETASRKPDSPEAKEFQADQQRLNEIKNQINSILTPSSTGAGGSSAGNALAAPPEFPLQAPTPMRDTAAPDSDPLGILGGTTAPTDVPQ